MLTVTNKSNIILLKQINMNLESGLTMTIIQAKKIIYKKAPTFDCSSQIYIIELAVFPG